MLTPFLNCRAFFFASLYCFVGQKVEAGMPLELVFRVVFFFFLPRQVKYGFVCPVLFVVFERCLRFRDNWVDI